MRALMTSALVLALSACTGTSTTGGGPTAGAPDVRATSYPVWYLAKRIGAPRLQPTLVLDEGEHPTTWQPSGEAVAALADADLILVHGAGYETWLQTATLPSGKVIDTSVGLNLIEIEGPTHSHGKGGEHSHTGKDPRSWMDPERFRGQARAVHAALVGADPGGQRIYDAQLGAVERNIDDLVAELDPILAEAKARPMAAAHPSFTYLAARGGWELPTIDLDGTTAPSPEVAAKASEGRQPGTLLLWDAPPERAVRDALPVFHHEVLDPLDAPRGEGYDYFSQARLNGFTLKKALATPLPAADTDETGDTDAAPESGQPTEDVKPDETTP